MGQIICIQVDVWTRAYAFANNFKHSLVKNRITMMMKKIQIRGHTERHYI